MAPVTGARIMTQFALGRTVDLDEFPRALERGITSAAYRNYWRGSLVCALGSKAEHDSF
jgi:hypothetical protein